MISNRVLRAAGFRRWSSQGWWPMWMVCAICLLVSCAEGDKKKWDNMFGGQKDGGTQTTPLFGAKRSGETEVWTIECNEYQGSNCRSMADSMVGSLKNVAALKGRTIWVQHEEGRSRVFCGEYPLKYEKTKSGEAQSDPQLSEALKKDLKTVRELAIGDQHPFFSARMRPKPLPDVGPAEWDLKNAKGAYTLNVGITMATPTMQDYKAAAVEWVKDLRQRGYEAYYFHSPDRPLTSICVGTFGEDAVRVNKEHVRIYSDAVKALRAKEEFRYNLENGAITYRSATGADGKRARMANESFLLKIPAKGK